MGGAHSGERTGDECFREQGAAPVARGQDRVAGGRGDDAARGDRRGCAARRVVLPETVFEVSRSLAIEAARVRLALFVRENPLPADGSAPAPPSEPCLLATPDTMTAAAVPQNIGLHLDPWLGGTTSSPELRSSSTPTGTVQGIPYVRCTTSRPGDGQVTRPELFAISLRGGVSFGDVARLHALDPILRVRPAGIGGEIAGGCLDSADTAVCVVLWQSRGLLLGVTLEGPPAFVNTSTAGAFVVDLVPDVIDSLAVIQGPPPVCNAETILVDTGVDLLEEPSCHDGWAVGVSAECPPDDTFDDSFETTTTIDPPCEAIRDVFHVEADGWRYNGPIDVRCAETLAALGMTAITAQEFSPICDRTDPALRVGTIRPDRTGLPRHGAADRTRQPRLRDARRRPVRADHRVGGRRLPDRQRLDRRRDHRPPDPGRARDLTWTGAGIAATDVLRRSWQRRWPEPCSLPSWWLPRARRQPAES